MRSHAGHCFNRWIWRFIFGGEDQCHVEAGPRIRCRHQLLDSKVLDPQNSHGTGNITQEEAVLIHRWQAMR